MRAAIVSPYFETTGGGERYSLTLAQALLDRSWQVDLTFNDPKLVVDARKKFSLPLQGVGLVDYRGFANGNLFKRRQIHRKYDLIFWFSDGAIPTLMARHNLLHFQVPFTRSYENPITACFKKRLIDLTVCNSNFTQEAIKRVFGINSQVWYPPIDTDRFVAGNKKQLILSVGRFEQSMTEKKQDVLIDCFKKMVNSGLKDWRFVLAGGLSLNRPGRLSKLKKQAIGYPIEFAINIPFQRLVQLYSSATIFWHAAGYNYDENKNPEKMEHFGMTTVEAMASGCIPVVIGKGGQKEIIEEGKNGYLCDGKQEIIKKTRCLIGNQKLINEMSSQAILRAGVFSTENFRKRVYGYLDSIN